MEELEIQYSQALANPKRETISHNSLLEALAFKATRTYRYNPLYRNIYSITIRLLYFDIICKSDKCNIHTESLYPVDSVRCCSVSSHLKENKCSQMSVEPSICFVVLRVPAGWFVQGSLVPRNTEGI